ncbi:MAG: phage tail tube protein [Treponema sp.]|nr:phage tail tube protein [Treponema sp.]
MELKKVRRVVSSALGELPLKEGGGTFTPSSFKRETQGAEVAENIGYVETPTAAVLVLTLNASLDPGDFRHVSNDTLTILLAGGSQHMMSAAWVTEAVELGAGEIKVTYNSAKSEKLK